MSKRLTVTRARTLLAPRHGQKDYFDAAEPGFAMRVTSKGVRSFVVFYRLNGKLRRDTIGQFDDKAKDGEPGSVGWARALAEQRRMLARNGTDPRRVEAEDKLLRQRHQARTYPNTVEEFIETHAKAKKGNRTWKEQRRILLSMGWNKPVSEVSREDVQAVLDTLMRQGKPYMANRTYAALRTFFSWCARRDYVPHHPMEKIERPFDGERARERHYDDDEIKAIWHAADDMGMRGAFLKVLLLTGVRRGELAGMKWSELDDGTWTIPPERVKASRVNRPRPHVVPLSKMALRIVEAQPKVGEIVFPGRRDGKPMSGWTQFQREVQRLSGVEDFGFHALRHTVRTGLSALGFPKHVKDAVLGHIETGTGAKYDHHEYLGEKRQALEAWADRVAKIVWPNGVVSLRG